MMRHTSYAMLLALVSLNAWATNEADRGLEIARAADAEHSGFGDSQARMTMTLINQAGDQVVRELRVSTLEGQDEGNKRMTVFDLPHDVRGTALLTWSYKYEDDDQWLYLPALRRVKTIASSNKSGAFMGSEFSFEDMSTQEVEKYTYHYARDEACGSLTCYVVERYPVDENSGYTKQVVWLDTEHYRVQKVHYYNRTDALFKTLRVSDWQLHDGEYWRAGHMEMTNHISGKRTELQWADYQFGVGLTDADFTQNGLKRAW